MFSFEEGTGTDGKIRSSNCYWKHFSLVLDSAFNLEPNIHVIRE